MCDIIINRSAVSITELHKAFTGNKKILVYSRDKSIKTPTAIAAPLDKGSIIWSRVVELISNYKELDRESIIRGEHQLFLKDFDKAYKNQEKHVLNCVNECFMTNSEGKRVHYIELSINKFVLLRGTNYIECMHSKLNKVWKKRVGDHLGNMLKEGNIKLL